MKQIIKLSEGCPYSCPFCFNGKNEFRELEIPEIKSNNVILHDDAFLSKKRVIDVINNLGLERINNKYVYYELIQGINVKDLNQSIANALYENRFKNIRIAWDGSYSKKNMQVVYDGIKYLNNAGYKNKNLMCFILSNYYVTLVENMLKAKIMLKKNIIVCNCVYRKNYLDPKIYPEHWTMKEIELFKEDCRTNNQLIIYDGYDPEVRTRLIRLKPRISICETEVRMKSITLENKTTKTKLEVKIFKDSISFFVLPRKHSKYWIPIFVTDEQYKIIKKELSNKT